MGLLNDIGDKLIADGLVEGTSGWDLKKSYMPDSPDKVVVLYELQGAAPDQTVGIAYEYPSFQVQVRAAKFKYDEARDKIQEIYNSLNNGDVKGFVYIYAADSSPALDEYDRNLRPSLFWGFDAMKSPDPMVITPSGKMTAGAVPPSVGSPADSFNITIPSANIGVVGQ